MLKFLKINENSFFEIKFFIFIFLRKISSKTEICDTYIIVSMHFYGALAQGFALTQHNNKEKISE